MGRKKISAEAAQVANIEETESFAIETQPVDELDESQNNVVEDMGEVLPQYSSPEWSDYVMSKFQEHELVEFNGLKCPTVGGLRRVAELVIGECMFSGPIAIDVQHPNQVYSLTSATVTYEVKFAVNMKIGFVGRTYRAVGGANQNNVDGEYALYAEAMAETRAEARALRKVLGLRSNIVSVEELTQKKIEDLPQPESSKTQEWEQNALATDNQKQHITITCKKLGIDLIKFINQGKNQYSSLDEVEKEVAAKMSKTLSSYLQVGDGSRNIPDSIKEDNGGN